MAGKPRIVEQRASHSGLTLYRLAWKARFDCARCRKARKSLLVAMRTRGDWQHVVCEPCYEAARKKSKKKQERQQKKKPRAPAVIERPRISDEALAAIFAGLPPIAARHPEVTEVIELYLRTEHRFECGACKAGRWSRIMAVDVSNGAVLCNDCKKRILSDRARVDPLMLYVAPLARFFRAARVPIRYRTDGWILVRGKEAFQSRSLGPRFAGWDDLIDRVVFADCPDLLVKALQRHGNVLGEGVRAYYDRELHAFELRRGEDFLGFLRPTRANIRRQRGIPGNYVTDGPHWRKLGEAIARHDAAAAEEDVSESLGARSSERWVTLLGPPDHVPPELIKACFDASAAIRLRRSVAYSHAVTLLIRGVRVRYSPIVSRSNGLQVPFELRSDGTLIHGTLQLEGKKDPLPVRLGHSTPEELLPVAWSTALLGFAAATCFSLDRAQAPKPSTQSTPRSTARERRPPATRGLATGRAPARTGRSHWPTYFEPTGVWALRGPSFVPGHRRRLTDGRTASEDARERARQVGIVLAPNETWVKPHTRGLGAEDEISFRWDAPPELAELLGVPV